MCRLIGESGKADQLEGVTVFEAKTVCTGVKRKRLDKGDPGDVEGYAGPWRGYVDQVTVSKPTEKQLALLEEQFGEKRKKKAVKETEDTIDESTLLHGVCVCVWVVLYWMCTVCLLLQWTMLMITLVALICTYHKTKMLTCVPKTLLTSAMLPRNSYTLGECPNNSGLLLGTTLWLF